MVHKYEYNKLSYYFNQKSFPLSLCPLQQKGGPPLKATKQLCFLNQFHVGWAEVPVLALDLKTCVAMLLVCVVATMGADLLLVELWLDGPTALVAPLIVGVLCVCPCQLGMYNRFRFVCFEQTKKLNKQI